MGLIKNTFTLPSAASKNADKRRQQPKNVPQHHLHTPKWAISSDAPTTGSLSPLLTTFSVRRTGFVPPFSLILEDVFESLVVHLHFVVLHLFSSLRVGEGVRSRRGTCPTGFSVVSLSIQQNSLIVWNGCTVQSILFNREEHIFGGCMSKVWGKVFKVRIFFHVY